ncbi:helix-turn-helix domain-containing protein [Actinoallomurus sp. NBC_01490]|uniref:helix-turn-helix domain-containing protein n=1 Tax=Actinoallomurus sp. NBC_01490 TaxID=2903557 RepID=UPI002E374882|nr:helix-turn-helix domain-containing protein [Actinoallomurus sp. NBC_01490]
MSSPHPLSRQRLNDEPPLRPREVAELFGVRTTTIARWAREGRLAPVFTPGGHRRYHPAGIRKILDSEASDDHEVLVEDAVRLYEQGWSIRQVADRFECSYGAMRRLLMSRVRLRNRGGQMVDGPGL